MGSAHGTRGGMNPFFVERSSLALGDDPLGWQSQMSNQAGDRVDSFAFGQQLLVTGPDLAQHVSQRLHKHQDPFARGQL